MIGTRPLTKEEISAIQKYLEPRDRLLFDLCLHTGLRIQEALSLRVNSFVAGRVHVERRAIKGKAAGRSLLLHPVVAAQLQAYVAAQGLQPGDPLFQSRLKRRLSRHQAWRALKWAVAMAGLKGKIATHSPRKTFAEAMYAYFGKDLVKTSKALGHRNIESTVSYLSFRAEEMDAAILALGR
jgi:integrase